MILETFRQNVVHELERLGWTRSDLARRMGCTPSYVYQVLSGYRDIGLEGADKIAGAMGVPLCRLIRDRRKVKAGR